ncbi:MAG: hypothetical protein AAF530_23915 [Pseudomonadota bacterium]
MENIIELKSKTGGTGSPSPAPVAPSIKTPRPDPKTTTKPDPISRSYQKDLERTIQKITPKPQILPELSASLLVADYKLDQQGLKDATKGIPAEASKFPPAIAHEVTAHAETLSKQRTTKLLANFEGVSHGFHRALRSARDPIPISAKGFAHEVGQILAKAQRHLASHSTAVNDRERALKAFIIRHELTRAVSRQDYLGVVVFFGVLALFLEACLGAKFLEDATPNGFGGGAAIAGLVALINVTLSGLAGLVVGRFVFVKDWGRRAFGIIGTAAFFTLIAGAHLAFATLRLEAIKTGDFQEALGALPATLTSGSFAVAADGISWVLIIFGLSVSAVAFWKGLYMICDPYPGYSRMVREVKDAKKQMETTIKEGHSEIDGLRDDTMETVKKAIGHKEAHFALASRYLRQLEDLEAAISAEPDVLRQAVAGARRAYWLQQQLVRGGGSGFPEQAATLHWTVLAHPLGEGRSEDVTVAGEQLADLAQVLDRQREDWQDLLSQLEAAAAAANKDLTGFVQGL